MKRLLLLALAVLPLSGCVEMLGARPLDFDCSRDELAASLYSYEPPIQVAQIQRDVGDDLAAWSPEKSKLLKSGMVESSATNPARSFEQDPIYRALTKERPHFEKLLGGGPADNKEYMLMLSGGGQWGAFGAGFLNAIRTREKMHPPRYDVITGVSTGAIQALFAATGSWDAMEAEYRNPKLPAKRGGTFTTIFEGFGNNTSPLRRRLEEVLCPGGKDSCIGFASLGEDQRPQVFIGMIEARTGDFKVLNVNDLARRAIKAYESDSKALRRGATCLAGVTMASAAVPVQLRPVRLTDGDLNPRTYTDGGVRLSVFEANIAEIANKAAQSREIVIYVVRNGPTVVIPNGDDKRPIPAPIDTKPTVAETGKMSYATLVNQNEVMSIAALRLLHPTGNIFVATADGYATHNGWQQRPDGSFPPLCRRNDYGRAFEHQFMVCLADWGREKAAKHPNPWIEMQ